MNGAKRAAENAIRELAARPFVFSAQEVASLADLTRDAPAVEEALRRRCLNQSVVFLGGHLHTDTPRRYFLGRDPALRWWCRYTVRLARLGIHRLSPPQLQSAMALSFDRRGWNALPDNLLKIGRQTGMVAEGCAPDSLVFPWATLLQTNPACEEAFRLMFFHRAPPNDLKGLTLGTILDKTLARLPEKQADVMRKRYGLDGERATLAQLGQHYRVTRERIRQIQSKASRQIAQPSFQLALWWAFIADFMRDGCELVIPGARLTPKRRFLHKMIRLDAQPVRELDVRIIGPARGIGAYRDSLRRDRRAESTDANDRCTAADELSFLPARSRQQLIVLEEQRREKQIAKNMSGMILKALRSLGRAAHYGEIAERCNELFPDNRKSTHHWHAALSRFAGEEKFGIVWIGAKGVYGLKEHGYWRPAESLYQSIPRIVREQFAKTRRPVPFDAVLRELSALRREFNRGSVQIVLSFSDQIEKINGDGYLPASAAPAVADAESKYDIAAAMRAFTSFERQENRAEDE